MRKQLKAKRHGAARDLSLVQIITIILISNRQFQAAKNRAEESSIPLYLCRRYLRIEVSKPVCMKEILRISRCFNGILA